jgi:hypothetical protein
MATSTTDHRDHPDRPEHPGTGLHGEGELDRTTDVGEPDRYATEDRHGIETGDFDREIDLRKILWTGVWLVVVVLVSDVVIWGFMRGIRALDDHQEVQLTPMQKIPQPPLPKSTPQLQISPTQDMVEMRAQEDLVVDHAAWVDRPGGTLRVPVDVAIDAIVQRGVAPFPAMGAAGGASTGLNPLQTRVQQETPNPTDNRKPGATVQSSQGPAVKPAAPAVKPPVR